MAFDTASAANTLATTAVRRGVRRFIVILQIVVDGRSARTTLARCGGCAGRSTQQRFQIESL